MVKDRKVKNNCQVAEGELAVVFLIHVPIALFIIHTS